jgi:6-phosphofructokinase 1
VHNQPLQVLGAPKTIDNDLMGVDVSPGYGSAARFIAQTTRNVALDLASMVGFDQITVVETMGRHTGWLAAASALGRERSDDPPHLIFFPEKQIDDEKLIVAVDDAYRRHGVCLVATSEGLRDGKGRFYAEKVTGAEKDASGQTLLSLSGGVAAYLAHLVQKQLGLRCRQIRFDAVQRSASASVSPVDRSLAAQVGAFAVELALAGQSGVMAGLTRTEDGWSNAARLLEEASGRERELPLEFMDAERHDVTPAFIDYCAPLVGELDLQAVQLHECCDGHP